MWRAEGRGVVSAMPLVPSSKTLAADDLLCSYGTVRRVVAVPQHTISGIVTMRLSVWLIRFGMAALALLLGAQVRGDYIVTDLGPGDALAINASGQVVGWSNTVGTSTSGFFYSNGTLTILNPGAVSGGARGINASGQVAGWYSINGPLLP